MLSGWLQVENVVSSQTNKTRHSNMTFVVWKAILIDVRFLIAANFLLNCGKKNEARIEMAWKALWKQHEVGEKLFSCKEYLWLSRYVLPQVPLLALSPLAGTLNQSCVR